MLNKVTVLMCNHNYDKYIADAIDSCLMQTYQPLQICIIDDKSTDNSDQTIFDKIFKDKPYRKGAIGPHTVHTLIDGNKFVYIALNNNVGPSFARNIGIDITMQDTDLYAVLDADDMMKPNKIKTMVDKINENGNIGVVYADYDILNVNTGNTIREYKHPYSKRMLSKECIVHSGAMFTATAAKEVADKFGYYDVNMRTCEDYEFWIRISKRCIISHIPQSLTIVRNHDKNSTFSVPNEVWHKNWSYIREKHG